MNHDQSLVGRYHGGRISFQPIRTKTFVPVSHNLSAVISLRCFRDTTLGLAFEGKMTHLLPSSVQPDRARSYLGRQKRSRQPSSKSASIQRCVPYAVRQSPQPRHGVKRSQEVEVVIGSAAVRVESEVGTARVRKHILELY